MILHRLSPTVTLYHGDCRDALRRLPDNSVDAVPCDPPYELNFMGKGWDDTGIANDASFWAEVFRVLKPGGHVAAFSASRTYHRMACAIEDAGFEIRDSLVWMYGSGMPKSQNVAKFIDKTLGVSGSFGGAKSAAHQQFIDSGTFNNADITNEGWRRPWMDDPEAVANVGRQYLPASPAAQEFDGFGTALKPATEPICLARKPLSEPTVAANVLRWRTGALNIDGCRVATSDGDSNARVYTAKRTAPGAVQNATGERHTDEVFEGASKEGRWPANVIHDGSDEVVGMFPHQKSGAWDGTRPGDKKNSVYGKFGAIAEKPRASSEGSAARFFFNTAESDTQWVARNSGKCAANDVPGSFSLLSALAVSALNNAVAQSMPRLVLKSTASPAHSTNVTPGELRRLSETLIETIPSFERKCSPESLPVRLSLSDNLASIAVACERIDTITITISLLKSNGCAEPVIFSIMRQNSEVGARDSRPSTSRFHYSAKASKADRNGSKHPTVKPIALMAWLARLITPPGGTILDPFAGSGTTGAAARQEGFRCVLMEREAEYVADIKRRFGVGAVRWRQDRPDVRAAWADLELRLRALARA